MSRECSSQLFGPLIGAAERTIVKAAQIHPLQREINLPGGNKKRRTLLGFYAHTKKQLAPHFHLDGLLHAAEVS